jgi:hypothetical protein
MLLATLLITVAVVEAALFVAIFRVFVLTAHGQQLDTIALASNTLGANDHLGRPDRRRECHGRTPETSPGPAGSRHR